jgi:hypothetical protein
MSSLSQNAAFDKGHGQMILAEQQGSQDSGEDFPNDTRYPEQQSAAATAIRQPYERRHLM